MDNFSKGFFTKLAELGVSPEQSVRLYKFADEAAGAGWQDTAKDYVNSYGGYGAGGAVLGGLLGALFNKKDRLRGALMGALAGGAGGAGLYAHNKAMDQAAATLSDTKAKAEERLNDQARVHSHEIERLNDKHEVELGEVNANRYRERREYEDAVNALRATLTKEREIAGRRGAEFRDTIDAQRGALNRLGGDGGLRDLMLNAARLYPAMVKDNVLPDFNDAAAISEFGKQLEGLRRSGIEGLDPFITAATNANARGQALEDARLERVAAREQAEAAAAQAKADAERAAAEKVWNSLRPEQVAAIKYLLQNGMPK